MLILSVPHGDHDRCGRGENVINDVITYAHAKLTTTHLQEIMEDIFAKKAWCDPVAVASSTGLSSKQSKTNESMGESDSGCSMKSNKTQVASLLAKRLRQKEDHEEQKMKRHKERMEMDEKFLKGFPRRKDDLQASVKAFLDGNPRPIPFKNNNPGRHWYRAFLKRHPNLAKRTPEAVSKASSNVSEKYIRKCFCNIEQYLKEKQYFDILKDPTRVFNGDETCFLLCPKEDKVIAPPWREKCAITPPMVIYPYKRLPTNIVNSVPNDWGIGTSDNGWMKSEVILIALYPNATRILQPADVSCFKPLKNAWKLAVLEWRRNHPFLELTKVHFAPILKDALSTLKTSSISNGFKTCGLCPWNVDKINFTKCLGKDMQRPTNSDTINRENGTLTCDDFINIVGPEKLKQLKEYSGNNTVTEDFKLLLKIFRKVQKDEDGVIHEAEHEVNDSVIRIYDADLSESQENHEILTEDNIQDMHIHEAEHEVNDPVIRIYDADLSESQEHHEILTEDNIQDMHIHEAEHEVNDPVIRIYDADLSESQEHHEILTEDNIQDMEVVFDDGNEIIYEELTAREIIEDTNQPSTSGVLISRNKTLPHGYTEEFELSISNQTVRTNNSEYFLLQSELENKENVTPVKTDNNATDNLGECSNNETGQLTPRDNSQEPEINNIELETGKLDYSVPHKNIILGAEYSELENGDDGLINASNNILTEKSMDFTNIIIGSDLELEGNLSEFLEIDKNNINIEDSLNKKTVNNETESMEDDINNYNDHNEKGNKQLEISATEKMEENNETDEKENENKENENEIEAPEEIIIASWWQLIYIYYYEELSFHHLEISELIESL
ncbi:hypothetical protein NQ318_002165 [Aromia moschata]|uniref:Uncharacterized protein n=1 Tax=Aromia moschata TaxID=1265417 RepID=A0AAV8XFC3_9CUCU|nr:hypothetical protein NQ318_002165 [Aromia moschata]